MQIDAERCIWEDVEIKDFQYLISISMPITKGCYSDIIPAVVIFGIEHVHIAYCRDISLCQHVRQQVSYS